MLSLSDCWVSLKSRSVLHTSALAFSETASGLEQRRAQPQHVSDHQRAMQNDPALRRKVLVNSLLYRSKQRGFLEMDLLVGIWAEKQVPNLSEAMLVQFSEVLDQENPDLYKWLTGQQQPPAAMAENAAYQVGRACKALSAYLCKQCGVGPGIIAVVTLCKCCHEPPCTIGLERAGSCQRRSCTVA